jgi:F-type H+-transporting ATPase subunit alpha
MESKYPQVLSEIAEKKVISDELDKTMAEALSAYDEEFKDTIK